MNHNSIALMLLLLMPQTFIHPAAQPSPIMVGFSCCQFYDSDSGTPVFMAGEEVWLKTEQDVTVALRDTVNREITRRYMPAYSTTRLHVFQAEDTPGLWQLYANGEAVNLIIPIYLAASQVKASLPTINYKLTETELSIAGTIMVNEPHQGGVLILNRENATSSLETTPVLLPNGQLRVLINWNATNPRTLNVYPYVPELISPNATKVWAEVSSEIALFKQVGATQLFTITPQIVTRTNQAAISIQSQPQQALKIILPNLHQLDMNGRAPLRQGRIHINVFVEVEKTIYTMTADPFLLSNTVVASPASVIQLPPLLSPITFELKDFLQTLSKYNLALVLRETGVNVVWNQPITPPVTILQVRNTMDDKLIDDYQITSNQIRETSKVHYQTYVIPIKPEADANLTLTVGGIQLRSTEFNPKTSKLQPLSTIEIRSPTSTLTMRVTDPVGNSVTSGILRLTRISPDHNETGSERLWEATNGTVTLTLPRGRYELRMIVEGIELSRFISVSEPKEQVEITLNELLNDSKNELILSVLGAVVILVELLLAIRIWKPHLKRSNPTALAAPSTIDQQRIIISRDLHTNRPFK